MPLTQSQAGTFAEVIDRLRDDSTRLFGTSIRDVRTRREIARPFSSVLEIEIRGEREAMIAFVKLLNPRAYDARELEATQRNVAREFDWLIKVHRGLAGYQGLSTPRPLACYPDLFALVTERVDGQPLTRLLGGLRGMASESEVEKVAGVMTRVGAWLRAFQTVDTQDGSVSLDRMRTYLDARLQPLADGGIIGEDVRTGLLCYFDRRMGEVSPADLATVPVHADFTPENVIVSPAGVAVLDFTMAKQGARYLDLTHMFMQIEMLKARPWFRPAVIDRQNRALVAGFDPSLAPSAPLFDVLLLQHVVCFVLQTAGMDVSGVPARLLAAHIRRRHLRWLRARARTG